MHMDYTPLIMAVGEPLLWLLPILVLVGLLQAFRPQLRGMLGERAVARVLKRHAAQVANDLILPNGLGGLTQIDHLALTANGILVIETKNYSGLVLGREHEPTWTQVIGRQRHSFQNPLRQNHGHLKAVQALVTDVHVEGLVVFVGSAKFPKGRPPGVLDLAGLERELARLPKVPIPLAMLMAWDGLIEHGRRDRRTRREHLRGVRAGRREDEPRAWRNGESRTGARRFARVMLQIGLAILIPFLLLVFLNQQLTSANRAPPQTNQQAPTSPFGPSPAATAVVSRSVDPVPVRPPPPTPRALQPEIRQPEPGPQLQWSDNAPESAATRRCREAQVAVLIDNSASNRQRRERACAELATEGVGAGSAHAPAAVVVDEPWRRLHSAGELTPND